MTDPKLEPAPTPEPMAFGGPTPHTGEHTRNVFWVPVDIATDLLGAAGHSVVSVLQGAGHVAAEGVRDIAGTSTALGGPPDQPGQHPRNILWIPVDVISGALGTGANVVHHVVQGVGTAGLDTVKNVAGKE